MSHKRRQHEFTPKSQADLEEMKKIDFAGIDAGLPQIAKGQNAENPLDEVQAPSWETSAKLAAYLRIQAVAFEGREHPARNALFALSIVAACCDSGVDLKSLREAVRVADACLRRFGV